ncbi:hypothetical protein ACWEP4_23475 [Streptomyces sp. NPDC004227]
MVITPAQVARSVAAGARSPVGPGRADALLEAMRVFGVPFLPEATVSAVAARDGARVRRSARAAVAVSAGGTCR